MNIRIFKVTLICGLILIPIFQLFSANQQEQNSQSSILFELGRSEIKFDLGGNADELERLADLLDLVSTDSLMTITKIKIDGYASPEGDMRSNLSLSNNRADIIREYITDIAEWISDDIFEINSYGVAWEQLREQVSNSEMADKEAIIKIIDEVEEETWCKKNPTDRYKSLVDSRRKHLMDLRGGRPWRYMEENYFPILRKSNIVTVCYIEQKPEPIIVIPEPVIETPVILPDTVPVVTEPIEIELKPFLAVKTNLAAYAAFVLNLGVEVKIGDKFSIDAPLYYSPYTLFDNYSFRILATQPEVRYWLTEALDGHFFGAHVMGGWYNVAYNSTTRYQDTDGESPFYGAGISYGYSLALNDNWAFEFTAGFGYLRLDYDMFYNIDNGAKYDTKVIDYWGPTKLGVNLVYKFNK